MYEHERAQAEIFQVFRTKKACFDQVELVNP